MLAGCVSHQVCPPHWEIFGYFSESFANIARLRPFDFCRIASISPSFDGLATDIWDAVGCERLHKRCERACVWERESETLIYQCSTWRASLYRTSQKHSQGRGSRWFPLQPWTLQKHKTMRGKKLHTSWHHLAVLISRLLVPWCPCQFQWSLHM